MQLQQIAAKQLIFGNLGKYQQQRLVDIFHIECIVEQYKARLYPFDQLEKVVGFHAGQTFRDIAPGTSKGE
jgi:hypothetical protein